MYMCVFIYIYITVTDNPITVVYSAFILNLQISFGFNLLQFLFNF